MSLRELALHLMRRFSSREVLTFLAVGGAGYVVDVLAFNLLLSVGPVTTLDPSIARTMALVAAMGVTYIGNRTLTWRHQATENRSREVGLFVLFNIIGFGFSVVTLTLSHDVLGLTSRLADNISANVIGLALGTIFRYMTYKRFVFAGHESATGPENRLLLTRPGHLASESAAEWEVPLPSSLPLRPDGATLGAAMHVVVVDDERRMVELIGSYLDEKDATSTGAYDGPTGLAAARGPGVDAVVLDLMQPGMSGTEVCKQLRREGNDVPVQMLTARGAVGERVAGLNAGADGYLVKPFALEELHARLRAIRRRREPGDD
jgi:CheY-like chemotaxis protein